MQTIQVVLDKQYGQQIIKPACKTSETFCQIAGTRTLTRPLVEHIKSLGYKVKVLQTLPQVL